VDAARFLERDAASEESQIDASRNHAVDIGGQLARDRTRRDQTAAGAGFGRFRGQPESGVGAYREAVKVDIDVLIGRI